jgi:hypothetical protein
MTWATWATRTSRSMQRTRWFEGTERGRFRLVGPARIESSCGRVLVTPGHASMGDHFLNDVGLAFKAGGRAPSFFTVHWPKVWDFYSPAFFLCPCLPLLSLFAPAAPPPLSPESRTKACHLHVELNVLQCDPLDAALPRRS